MACCDLELFHEDEYTLAALMGKYRYMKALFALSFVLCQLQKEGI